MNSDGDPIGQYLRILRVHMDALGQSVDEALTAVPEEVREQVRMALGGRNGSAHPSNPHSLRTRWPPSVVHGVGSVVRLLLGAGCAPICSIG